MPSAQVTPVQQQVRSVSRRLFVQTLLDQLVWCWAVALVLVTLWLLLHPFLVGAMTAEVRWLLIGGGVGGATVLAGILAWLRRPSAVVAALALDEKFALKERVTTSLLLRPADAASPAGQALLADVNQRVAGLQVGTRFPLRLSWSAATVPLCAGLLALVAILYEPVIGTPSTTTLASNKQTTNPDDIAKKFDELKKGQKTNWPKDDPRTKEDKIVTAWEKLINKPLDANDKDQVRERLEAMKPLEDMIKERMADLKAQADKNRKFADQLKQFGKDQSGDKRAPKDGPGKDLEDALAKGDLDKVEKEMKRLAEKIEKNELNDEERKKLEDQLKDIQERIGQLADLKDLKDKLQEAKDAHKINEDQFDRAMEQIKIDAAELKELRALADKLQQCQNCMKDGDGKNAAGKLAGAAALLKKMDAQDKELQGLLADQKLLDEARNAMCQGLQQNGMGQGQQPGTHRPIAKDKETGSKDLRQHADHDKKSPLIIQGITKGGTFNPIPSQEVGGVFKRVAQDAREAIDQQRVPPGTEDFLQGYFNKLGGQK